MSKVTALLICAAAIAAAFFFAKLLIPMPVIAVLEITGPIADHYARQIIDRLQSLGENRSISAIILQIDSPGGTATDSEAIYITLNKIRRKKPIVAVVANALSGAYYIALGSNTIIATPSASIGSIGGRADIPKKPDGEIVTGPYKEFEEQLERERRLQQAVDGFIQVILVERQTPLSASQLAEARTYTGLEAVQLGLVDRLGYLMDAVEEAAALAGLKKYQVVKV